MRLLLATASAVLLVLSCGTVEAKPTKPTVKKTSAPTPSPGATGAPTTPTVFPTAKNKACDEITEHWACVRRSACQWYGATKTGECNVKGSEPPTAHPTPAQPSCPGFTSSSECEGQHDRCVWTASTKTCSNAAKTASPTLMPTSGCPRFSGSATSCCGATYAKKLSGPCLNSDTDNTCEWDNADKKCEVVPTPKPTSAHPTKVPTHSPTKKGQTLSPTSNSPTRRPSKKPTKKK